MDYDFQIANATLNAGLINLTYQRLITRSQNQLAQAKVQGNRDMYRVLYQHICTEWIKECPSVVSPRAKNDPEFRAQLIAYLAECQVTKDFDPQQQTLSAELETLNSSLQPASMPDGTRHVTDSFWDYAALFKKQIDSADALIRTAQVDQMDPDHTPPEVALRIQASIFAQTWLPHLAAAETDKLLALFDLAGIYEKAQALHTDHHRCGVCGSDVNTVLGAKQVVCDSCSLMIDVFKPPLPCPTCGAQLSLPINVDHILCPQCKTDLRRA
jgi:DNA-directed RNA polymerase subunit RPC12/RpoP